MNSLLDECNPRESGLPQMRWILAAMHSEIRPCDPYLSDLVSQIRRFRYRIFPPPHRPRQTPHVPLWFGFRSLCCRLPFHIEGDFFESSAGPIGPGHISLFLGPKCLQFTHASSSVHYEGVAWRAAVLSFNWLLFVAFGRGSAV